MKKVLNINQIKQIILPILLENGATKVGLFGSVVRKEATNSSDVDILVDMPTKDLGMLGLMKIVYRLEDELQKEVDLVFYKNLNHRLKKSILEEEIRIYG